MPPLRTVVAVPSPGSVDTAVWLTNQFTTPMGIGHPENTGQTVLTLNGPGGDGQPIGDAPLHLNPGDAVDWFLPPEGSKTIAVACWTDATVDGELTYDTPIS